MGGCRELPGAISVQSARLKNGPKRHSMAISAGVFLGGLGLGPKSCPQGLVVIVEVEPGLADFNLRDQLRTKSAQIIACASVVKMPKC